MNKQWNAKDYAKDFSFVPQYGANMLELLAVKPGEHVLDLGCGNGLLTKQIQQLGADVIGIDSSAEMLEIAKVNYPDIRFSQADATDFQLENPVDAVFSNAVFHWIEDQHALLTQVDQALKPGGRLVCEFGGQGCVQTIHVALKCAFEKRGFSYTNPFFFPTVGQYAPMLEQHNFKVAYASLFSRQTELPGEQGMEKWINMFVKQAFEAMDIAQQQEIIADAVQQLRPQLYIDGKWYADYVRIQFKAIKQ